MDEITIKTDSYIRHYVNNDGLDTIKVEVEDLANVSDGYHTIAELYDHRCLLFLSFLQQFSESWISKKHADGSTYDGWFIAGITLLTDKQISYHIPEKYWDLATYCADEIETAPEFDGHTSDDVLLRLEEWIKKSKKGEVKRIINGKHILNGDE